LTLIDDTFNDGWLLCQQSATVMGIVPESYVEAYTPPELRQQPAPPAARPPIGVVQPPVRRAARRIAPPARRAILSPVRFFFLLLRCGSCVADAHTQHRQLR
jgi:hypothetical protein